MVDSPYTPEQILEILDNLPEAVPHWEGFGNGLVLVNLWGLIPAALIVWIIVK